MELKYLAASAIPKRRRRSESRFEKTDKWTNLKKAIDKGIPEDQAVQVLISDEEKQEYRIANRRTIAKSIQKYLADNGIKYQVKSQRAGDHDAFFVIHPKARKRR